MLFKVETEDFLKDLSSVIQIIPKHTTFPILSNIRIEAVNKTICVFGTDLDTSISYTTNLVDIKEDGIMVIPAKTLYSMMREIKGKTTFTKEESKVKVEYSHGYFFLPLIEEEDFPLEPEIKKEDAWKINTKEIKESIDKLLFIVPEDSAKRNMSGMLWEYSDGVLKMVATDSFRLGYKEIKIDFGEESFRVVIPPKILKQVSFSESKEMWVGVDESRIYYIGDRFIMVSRLIKVDFPNYQSAIPEDNNNILNIKKDSLISSMRRISVFSDDKNKTVILNIGQDISLGISSEIGEGKEELKGEYNGDEITIALSASYLIEILHKIDSNDVTLRFGKTNTPFLIEGEKKDTLYILMPVVME